MHAPPVLCVPVLELLAVGTLGCAVSVWAASLPPKPGALPGESGYQEPSVPLAISMTLVLTLPQPAQAQVCLDRVALR